jgi:hypothetical protein
MAKGQVNFGSDVLFRRMIVEDGAVIFLTFR